MHDGLRGAGPAFNGILDLTTTERSDPKWCQIGMTKSGSQVRLSSQTLESDSYSIHESQ
jgi:hypothetical protein